MHRADRRLPVAELRRRLERAEDEPFLRALFDELHAPLFASLEAPLRAILLAQQARARDAGHRAQHPDARREVVELDGRPVGLLVTDASGDALEVVDLVIAAAARGQGLGTALLGALCREAAAAGRPVRLRVAHGNVAARRLYARLGFLPVANSDVDVTLVRAPAA